MQHKALILGDDRNDAQRMKAFGHHLRTGENRCVTTLMSRRLFNAAAILPETTHVYVLTDDAPDVAAEVSEHWAGMSDATAAMMGAQPDVVAVAPDGGEESEYDAAPAPEVAPDPTADDGIEEAEFLDMPALQAMKRTELLDIAREHGIKIPAGCKKADIVAILVNAES